MDNIKSFLESSIIKNQFVSGSYVWEYFLKYGSENHSKYENPMFDWKDDILKNDYVEKNILIKNLIKHDVDLNEFFESEKENGFSNYNKGRLVNKNIIIGDSNYAKDVVIDGYHRIVQNIVNGKRNIMAFVPLNSKFLR